MVRRNWRKCRANLRSANRMPTTSPTMCVNPSRALTPNYATGLCTAPTIATGSFFLGQQKFLPQALHGSPLLFIPVFAPLLATAFWLVRRRLKPRRLKFSAPIPAAS
jgi:hypothetical protein